MSDERKKESKKSKKSSKISVPKDKKMDLSEKEIHWLEELGRQFTIHGKVKIKEDVIPTLIKALRFRYLEKITQCKSLSENMDNFFDELLYRVFSCSNANNIEFQANIAFFLKNALSGDRSEACLKALNLLFTSGDDYLPNFIDFLYNIPPDKELTKHLEKLNWEEIRKGRRDFTAHINTFEKHELLGKAVEVYLLEGLGSPFPISHLMDAGKLGKAVSEGKISCEGLRCLALNYPYWTSMLNSIFNIEPRPKDLLNTDFLRRLINIPATETLGWKIPNKSVPIILRDKEIHLYLTKKEIFEAAVGGESPASALIGNRTTRGILDDIDGIAKIADKYPKLRLSILREEKTPESKSIPAKYIQAWAKDNDSNYKTQLLLLNKFASTNELPALDWYTLFNKVKDEDQKNILKQILQEPQSEGCLNFIRKLDVSTSYLGRSTYLQEICEKHPEYAAQILEISPSTSTNTSNQALISQETSAVLNKLNNSYKITKNDEKARPGITENDIMIFLTHLKNWKTGLDTSTSLIGRFRRNHFLPSQETASSNTVSISSFGKRTSTSISDYLQGAKVSTLKEIRVFEYDRSANLTKTGEKQLIVYLLDQCHSDSDFLTRFRSDKTKAYGVFASIIEEVNSTLEKSYDFKRMPLVLRDGAKESIARNKDFSPGLILYASYKDKTPKGFIDSELGPQLPSEGKNPQPSAPLPEASFSSSSSSSFSSSSSSSFSFPSVSSQPSLSVSEPPDRDEKQEYSPKGQLGMPSPSAPYVPDNELPYLVEDDEDVSDEEAKKLSKEQPEGVVLASQDESFRREIKNSLEIEGDEPPRDESLGAGVISDEGKSLPGSPRTLSSSSSSSSFSSASFFSSASTTINQIAQLDQQPGLPEENHDEKFTPGAQVPNNVPASIVAALGIIPGQSKPKFSLVYLHGGNIAGYLDNYCDYNANPFHPVTELHHNLNRGTISLSDFDEHSDRIRLAKERNALEQAYASSSEKSFNPFT